MLLRSIGGTLNDGWRMRDWVRLEATLLTGGYEVRTGDDSDTYEAYARFEYTFRGRNYTGDRVAISSGADNIGNFQRELSRSLAAEFPLKFGLLYAVWRMPNAKDPFDPVCADQPWLRNRAWQSASIRSNSRLSMRSTCGFAILWNAIASVAPLLAWHEIVRNDNWLDLIPLLFTLLGIGLLYRPGFRGDSQANAAIRLIAREFDLDTRIE